MPTGWVPQTEFDKYKTAAAKRLEEANRKKASSSLTIESVNEAIAKAIADAANPKKSDDKSDSPEVADMKRRLAAIEEKETKLTTERDQAVKNLADKTIHNELLAAATTSGARSESASILAGQAAHHVELNSDGSVRSKLESALGADLSAAEIIGKMKALPAYRPFWPESKGGGAGGGDPASGPTDTNPWLLKSWDMLSQHKLIRDNGQKADTLSKAAGLSGPIATRGEAEAAHKAANPS